MKCAADSKDGEGAKVEKPAAGERQARPNTAAFCGVSMLSS